MADEKSASKAWTDTEKMGLFIQIIERFGTIPWDDLTLPEGRTKKACTVMVDKEKQKVKKAREAAGGDGQDSAPVRTPKGGKKRKEDGEATLASTKKCGSGRKKAVKAGADDEADEAAGQDDMDVKAEEEKI